MIAANVGIDPRKDIEWITGPSATPMQLFVDGKVDAFLGFPPQPQELRARNIDKVYGLLGGTFRERTTAEWLELFRSLDIPAAPLRTPDELFDNEHLNAVGLFETVDTSDGPVRFPGVPTWFSRTPGHVAGPTPKLGADTQEVLDEIGLAAPVGVAAPTGKQEDVL